jgi:tol-pal system protein YbgF
LELKTGNILLAYDGGKILRPLDQAELIRKITQEAGKYSALTVIPFVGSLVALQQLIVNNRVRNDSDDIINTCLKDIDIPPRMSIRGNIYFPAVENIEELIVYLKRENRLMKFQIPFTQSISARLSGGKSLSQAEVLYNHAFAQYKVASYKEAIQEFSGFLKKFPRHNLADNAQYWIGESYYSLGSFPEAIYTFQKVITYYPKGNKAPDALLKIGLCHLATKNEENARAMFQKLVAEYPSSNAARLAHMKLREN